MYNLKAELKKKKIRLKQLIFNSLINQQTVAPAEKGVFWVGFSNSTCRA